MAIAGSYHCLRLEVHREETGSQGPVPRSPEENWATVGDLGHERNSAAARDGIQAGEEKILYFFPPQPTLQSPANESPRQHLASSLLTKHPGKQSLKSPLSAIQSRGEAEEEA